MESSLFSSIVFSRLWFSVWESGLTVVLSVTIGGGLAWAEHTWRIRQTSWFTGLMVLPVFLPSAVVALGFIAVWGNAGYVNDFLSFTGIATAIGMPPNTPIHFLYSPAAIIAAHCFYNIPLAYIALRLRLSSHGQLWAEAARTLGASAWQAFRSITWPHIRVSVIGVSSLIFLYSFMSFAVPLILGGIQYQTLEVYIYHLVTQQLNFSAAVVMAIIQFLLISGILWLLWRNNNSALPDSFRDSLHKSLRDSLRNSLHEQQLERVNTFGSHQSTLRQRFIIYSVRLTMALYVVAPIISVLARGLQRPAISHVLNAQFISALLYTLGIATMATGISLVVAWLFMVYVPRRTSSLPYFILAISPITLGLVIRFTLGQQLLSLLIAYCLMLIPILFYVLDSQWQSRPHHFTSTLKLLGAQSTQRIVASLRWLAPAISRSLALGFTLVLGDIAVASMLAPFSHPTVMHYSYRLIGSYRFANAAAGMSLVVLLIGGIVGILFMTQRLYDTKRA